MTELTTSASASSQTLPEATRSMLHRELDVGERLLWAGQPVPAQLARAQLPLLLFSVPWTAFVLCWVVGATQASGFFGLFGVPFVLRSPTVELW